MFKFQYMAVVVAAVFCLAAQADDEPEVTPYRPTVSNPAQLSTPGQLELEFGGLESQSGSARRGSLPYLFKLAFDEEWGVLLGGEALVRNADSGVIDTGIGDTNITLKRAFLIDEKTAFGLELNVKAPTAKSPIGTGKTDYGINGIVSRDLGSVHMDVNLNVTRIGTADSATGNVQTGYAAAFSFPVAQQWGMDAELSGTHRNLVPDTAQFLVAATYSPSRSMTLDFGVIRGLNSATPDWAIFSGIVVPVTKFW